MIYCGCELFMVIFHGWAHIRYKADFVGGAFLYKGKDAHSGKVMQMM